MKKFLVIFRGRELGAIGAFYDYAETVEGIDAEAAVLTLYDRFESVHVVRIERIEDV